MLERGAWNTSAWDVVELPEMVAVESIRPRWVDRLVELHILSEHGNLNAAREAIQWMSSDPAARQLWDAVDRTCTGLRGPAVPGVEPPA